MPTSPTEANPSNLLPPKEPDGVYFNKRDAPGFFRMTLRFLVSTGFNPLVDLVWLNNDDSRQELRDKLCGTYVVKRSAIPAGRGVLVYTNVFVLGMSLIYREVRRKA